MLVSFKDLNDPKSVKLGYDVQTYSVIENDQWVVKSRIRQDNFEVLFGKGVKLKNITIEMTDESVTRGIEARLAWLIDLGGAYLHGKHTSRNAPLGLGTGNFRTGKE